MKKNVEISIYTVLILSIITSLILHFTKNYIVDNKFYIGIACVLIAFAIRLKSLKISNYLLGLSLVLGTLNLIKFSHIDFGFSFTLFGIDTFGFNLIILILLIMFLSVNKEMVQKISGGSQELTEEEKNELEEQRIRSFMEQNAHKSIGDLQEIVDNQEKYVKHLVISSQRLIEEKKNVL